MKAMVTSASSAVRALFCSTVSFMGIPLGLNPLVRATTAKVPLTQINTGTAPPT